LIALGSASASKAEQAKTQSNITAAYEGLHIGSHHSSNMRRLLPPEDRLIMRFEGDSD